MNFALCAEFCRGIGPKLQKWATVANDLIITDTCQNLPVAGFALLEAMWIYSLLRSNIALSSHIAVYAEHYLPGVVLFLHPTGSSLKGFGTGA